ncbi:hypothetical protein J8J40_33545, partial [Mycobacterium tuberculosis]|nr:hypothetical protein [Mycobacterium tuberculosis]
FRKLHVFSEPGDHVMMVATAGNLSISQSVVSLISEGLKNPETEEVETIHTQTSMFRAAQFVGRAVREVYRIDGRLLEEKH